MKHEGIRGFYRGFGITLTREVSLFLPPFLRSILRDAVTDTFYLYPIPLVRILQILPFPELPRW